MKNKYFRLSTTHLILLSFLILILIGSLLLYLPISSANEQRIGYIDALFTATTSACVTGLVTQPTAYAWSFFGQMVILLLIQIGGLGVITVLTIFMIAIKKRMGLNDRLLLQDSFNLNSLSGIIRFVIKVVKGTLIIEAIGALLYMTVFVPEFGAKGIWISIFNSVSAFCNAGMDIIADKSLCAYYDNFIVNAVTSALIILGGIGFIVWWDIIEIIKNKKRLSQLKLHTKIVLITTLILIVSGGFLVFICEYNNPLTMKNFSFWNKVQASIFQSVTTRTAGFVTVPQENLTEGTTLVSLILMFIGGSPVGTAGGIKTITLAVLFSVALSSVKNKKEINIFNRNISEYSIRKAVAVTMISFITVFISTLLMCLATDAPLGDILYETVSAAATVGLSKNLTSSLNVFGKLVIICTMYFGRVGPISMVVALNKRKRSENIVKNPVEEVSIG